MILDTLYTLFWGAVVTVWVAVLVLVTWALWAWNKLRGRGG